MDARLAWERFDREKRDGRVHRTLKVSLADDEFETPNVIRDQTETIVDHYVVNVPKIMVNLLVFLSELYEKYTTENVSHPIYIDFVCDFDGRSYISDFLSNPVSSFVLSMLRGMHHDTDTANIYGRIIDTRGVVDKTVTEVSYETRPLSNEPTSFWGGISSPCGLDLSIPGSRITIQPSWNDALRYYQELYRSPIEHRHLCRLKYSDNAPIEKFVSIPRDQLFCALLRLDGWNLVKINNAIYYDDLTASIQKCTSIGLMWVIVHRPSIYPSHDEFAKFIQACTETLSTPSEIADSEETELVDSKTTALSENKRIRQDIDSDALVVLDSKHTRTYSGRRTARVRSIRICLNQIPPREADILLSEIKEKQVQKHVDGNGKVTETVEAVPVSLIEIVRRSYVHRFDLEYDLDEYLVARAPFESDQITPGMEILIRIGQRVDTILKSISDKFNELPLQEFNFQSNCLAMSYVQARRYPVYLDWKAPIEQIGSFDELTRLERMQFVKKAYEDMSRYFKTITWDTRMADVPDSHYEYFENRLNVAFSAALIDDDQIYANHGVKVNKVIFDIDLDTLLNLGYQILVHWDFLSIDMLSLRHINTTGKRRYPRPDERYHRHLAYAKLREKELLAHGLAHNMWHITGITNIIKEILGHDIFGTFMNPSTFETMPEFRLIPRYLRDENMLQPVKAFNLNDLNIRRYIMGLSLDLDRADQIKLTLSVIKHVFAAVSHTVQVLWPYGIPPMWKNTILDILWTDFLANDESASSRKIRGVLERLNKTNQISKYYNEISRLRYFVILMYVLHTDLIGQMNERQITMISTLFSRSSSNYRRTRVIANDAFLW